MKKGYLLLLAAMAGLASCQWGSQEKKQSTASTTDTLSYAYDTVARRAADCGDKPDSTCTHVEIIYPKFTAAPALNDSVSQKIRYLFAFNGKADSSINLYADNFVKGYNNFKKQEPQSVMYYELETNAQVLRQDSALVTLQVSGYSFEGGAHGASFTTYINWNTSSNSNLLLADIFTNGYNAKLTAVGDSVFRVAEKLSPTESLATNYFFKDDKFALNDNFLITPIGIKFLYNQYEIKPYAAGRTELLIPYNAIKSILKPNTVVSQYIK